MVTARCAKLNAQPLELRIGTPTVSADKLRLYDRYHAFQTEDKDWPDHPPKDVDGYCGSFVDNPLFTEEWCYHLNDKLVGVGYVDAVPKGLSAIYFFYDPDERGRSLGTFNVLSAIGNARESKIPHVYLGYYVEGCPSMSYKPRFAPNQLRGDDGVWRDFRR